MENKNRMIADERVFSLLNIVTFDNRLDQIWSTELD